MTRKIQEQVRGNKPQWDPNEQAEGTSHSGIQISKSHIGTYPLIALWIVPPFWSGGKRHTRIDSYRALHDLS